MAFQLFAANIRKIDEFLTNKAAGDKKVRRFPARRKAKSLQDWVPTPGTVATATVDDGSADPDPPLTA